MARSFFDPTLPALTTPGLVKAADTIANALNREIGGRGKPVIITPDTLALLFAKYRSHIASNTSHEDRNVVSRFTDALTRFAKSVRSLEAFKETRPSSQQIAELFENFCKLGEIHLKLAADNLDLAVIDITPAEAREIFGSAPKERKAQKKQLTEVVDAYLAVARSRFGGHEGSRYADQLEVVAKGVSHHDAVQMAYLLKLELSEQMCAHIQSFMDIYEHWFFVDFTEDVQRSVRFIESAAALGDNRSYLSAVRSLQGATSLSRHAIHLLHNLSRYMKNGPLTVPFYGSTACADVIKRHWDPMMLRLEGFVHDYNNIITTPLGYADVLMTVDCESAKEVQGIIDFLKTIDYSTIGSMFGFVKGTLRRKAVDADAKILVNVGEKINHLHIPKDVRSTLFRVMFELGLNAVKYADREKGDKRIYLNASMRGANLRILIADNGIGIENIEGAKDSGLREHPELAEGKGLGLASVMALTDDKDWDFEIDSRVGFGTTASVEIDTSKWGNGPKKVGGGGLGGGHRVVQLADWPASILGASIYPDLALHSHTSLSHSTTLNMLSSARLAFNVIPVLA